MSEKKNIDLNDSPIPYFVFGRPEMSPGRWLTIIIALFYLLFSAHAAGVGGVLRTLMALMMPMACIWFGDEMGDYVGGMVPQSITKKTPASLIGFLGWLALLSALWMPLVVGFIRWLN